jgi:signal transduction histidine kinase/DNA-binding response OmpR family regulator
MTASATAKPIVTIALARETDIVLVRQRARQIAALLGFDTHDQTRITTAVSEIARNVLEHGRGGRTEFRAALDGRRQGLEIVLSDEGPGIADLDAVLAGDYQSPTGMGIGLRGARRLMDAFAIESAPARGTTVAMRKDLPARTPRLDAVAIRRIGAALARQAVDPLDDVRRQNQDLVASLEALKARQEELAHLNEELEDTNRGVVALYAELDEKADHLRRADELKTRFLSNMTHEFRTPLNSILALSRMLQERLDGELTGEQEKQVGFIRSSAETLSDLVNDLLDLAKVEAGKTVIAPSEFTVDALFGALRGMLRPLLAGEAVTLAFDDAEDLPGLDTDESKLSQILRNFISNALKFTERGEVRVSAAALDGGERLAFTVRDTGIGIAADDLERIFDEYAQVENPLQRQVKGTGLGLPLSKRLAELLGGAITVDSTPGAGSAFTLTVPRVFTGERPAQAWQIAPGRLPVLAIEDTGADVAILERYLADTRYQLLAVPTIGAARTALASLKPSAILLDALLVGEQCWPFLIELKRGWTTRDIPIVLLATMEEGRRALGMGADDYAQKPVSAEWLIGALDRLVGVRARHKVLVIDDDLMSRYLVRRYLADLPVVVSEAASGREGLERAQRERPDVVCLDIRMPVMDGYQVIERLAADPVTRDAPIVVITATPAGELDHARLQPVRTVLSKDGLSRDALARAIGGVIGLAPPEPDPTGPNLG